MDTSLECARGLEITKMLRCTKGAIIRVYIGGNTLEPLLSFVRRTMTVRSLETLDPAAKSVRKRSLLSPATAVTTIRWLRAPAGQIREETIA